jgi:glutathione S-transferase
MQLDPAGQEMYPHIYGPLNLDAVVDVTPLVTAPDGAIKVPDLST